MSEKTVRPGDFKFRHMQTKAQWGFKPFPNNNSIVCLSDSEYLIAIGSTLMKFDNHAHQTRKSCIIEAFSPDVLYYYMMTMSVDNKYLAILARMKEDDDNTVNMLIYNVERQILTIASRIPRNIQY